MSKQPVSSMRSIQIEPIEPAPRPFYQEGQLVETTPGRAVAIPRVKVDTRKPVYAKIPLETAQRLDQAVYKLNWKAQDIINAALNDWLKLNGF